MPPRSTTRRERIRFLWYVGVVLLVVGSLAIGAILFRVHSTSATLQQFRAQIAAAGEPLSAADLCAGRSPGDGATLKWLKEFGDIHWSWRELGIHEPERLQARLEALAGTGGAPDDIDDLAAFLDCLRAPGSDPARELLRGFEERPDELPELEQLDECQRLAFHACRGVDAHLLDRALESEALEPIDGASLLPPRRMPAVSEVITEGVTDDYLRLVNTLTRGAVIAAIDGDDAQALRLLELGFHAAELMADVSWPAPHLAWVRGERLCLVALRFVLPCLPQEVELSAPEARVRRLDPRGSTLAALRGERAFSFDIFEAMRRGEIEMRDLYGTESMIDEIQETLEKSSERVIPGSWMRFRIDAEQLRYLEFMEQALAELERGGVEGRRELAALQAGMDSRAYARRRSLLGLPELVELLEASERLEEERRLVLAAMK